MALATSGALVCTGAGSGSAINNNVCVCEGLFVCVCVCMFVCVCVYMFVGVCSWAVGFSICLWYVLVYPSRSGLSKVPFSVFLSVPVFSPKPPISSFSSVSREPEKVKPALIIHFVIHLLIFGPRTQNPDR